MSEGLAAHTRHFERLANGPMDLRSVPDELLEALARVVPFDAFGCGAVDPTSLLSTRAVDTTIPFASPQLWEVQDLVVRGLEPRDIGALGRPGPHVARLSDIVNPGDDSPIHQRILRPNGLEHQLRAALVVDGTHWGLLHLERRPDRPDFTSTEVTLIAALVPHLGHAFRRWLLADPHHTTQTRRTAVPGVIVLDEDNEVDSISAEAEHWLSDWGLSNLDSPPAAIAAVVAAARARAEGNHNAQIPSARLRLRTGAWLHVHATHLTHPDQKPRTAIVLEQARPEQVAPMIARANQLTARETQIAMLVLRGRSTSEIATQLFISPYTVQDHLKSIFEKVGVHSRRELATEIFEPHYHAA